MSSNPNKPIQTPTTTKTTSSNNSNNTTNTPATSSSLLNCPVHNCKSTQTWKQKASLAKHLDSHLNGVSQPVGVSKAVLKEMKLVICPVCKLTVSASHKIHTNCRSTKTNIQNKAWRQKSPNTTQNSNNNNNNSNNNIFHAPQTDNLDLTLPSFLEIFKLNVRVLQFVPKRARNDWGKIFTRTIIDVMSIKDFDSYTKFFMLTKCLLWNPKGKIKDSLDNIVKKRISRWNNGEYRQLWLEALNAVNSDRSDAIVYDRYKRAARLASMGRFSSACAALEKEGLAPVDEKTFEELKQKHPDADRPILPVAQGAAIRVNSNAVLEQLKSFPVGSAGAYDGLRPQHVLEAVKTAQNREPLEALTSFVNWLLGGNLTDDIAVYFAGAPLLACNKKDGGIRPLAIGHTIRRLVSKCACHTMKEKFQAFFSPVQLGVGVKGGAETIVHAVEHQILKNKNVADYVLLKIDLENAFNRVDRTKFLEFVKEKFPEIYHWVRCCYMGAPLLLYGPYKLVSAEGTQQGDPLGPALFSMVLKLVTDQIVQSCKELDVNVWYLDDGVIGCDTSTVAKAFEILQKEGPKYGLYVQVPKCELFYPSNSNLNRNLFPTELKVVTNGLGIMGAPIGSNDFCATFFKNRLEKLKRLLVKIDDIENTQVSFLLLNKCVAYCRFAFFSRTSINAATFEVFQQFDCCIRKALESLVGSSTTDSQWKQATLSIRLGGLGLRSVYEHRYAAYAASLDLCRNTLSKVVKGDTILEDLGLDDVISNYNMQVEPADHIGKDNIGRQFDLSDGIQRKALKQLVEPMEAVHKGRLACLQGPLSSGWLTAVPVGANEIISRHFTALLKCRLGIPLVEEGAVCEQCGKELDLYGIHMITCIRGGDRGVRHDVFRDALLGLCQEAAWRPEPEKSGLLSNGSLRPADVWIPTYELGRGAAVDVTITHPLQPSFINLSAERWGVAAEAAEQAKIEKYAGECEREGFVLIPLAVEALGGLAKAGMGFLNMLCQRLASRKQEPRAIVMNQIRQRLSIALHRMIAKSISKRDGLDSELNEDLGVRRNGLQEWRLAPADASSRYKEDQVFAAVKPVMGQGVTVDEPVAGGGTTVNNTKPQEQQGVSVSSSDGNGVAPNGGVAASVSVPTTPVAVGAKRKIQNRSPQEIDKTNEESAKRRTVQTTKGGDKDKGKAQEKRRK